MDLPIALFSTDDWRNRIDLDCRTFVANLQRHNGVSSTLLSLDYLRAAVVRQDRLLGCRSPFAVENDVRIDWTVNDFERIDFAIELSSTNEQQWAVSRWSNEFDDWHSRHVLDDQPVLPNPVEEEYDRVTTSSVDDCDPHSKDDPDYRLEVPNLAVTARGTIKGTVAFCVRKTPRDEPVLSIELAVPRRSTSELVLELRVWMLQHWREDW